MQFCASVPQNWWGIHSRLFSILRLVPDTSCHCPAKPQRTRLDCKLVPWTSPGDHALVNPLECSEITLNFASLGFRDVDQTYLLGGGVERFIRVGWMRLRFYVPTNDETTVRCCRGDGYMGPWRSTRCSGGCVMRSCRGMCGGKQWHDPTARASRTVSLQAVTTTECQHQARHP
jgi:hypothetical protein